MKGIPEAIITYKYACHWKPTEYELRSAICMERLFKAIEKHLPGEWTIEARYDDTETKQVTRARWATITRKSDGVCIDLYSDWGGTKESKVRVAPGTFYYTVNGAKHGDSIDGRWLFNKRPEGVPSACIDITKRNAKAIAGDIVRRVIDPTAAIMPRVVELQAERTKRDNGYASSLALIQAVKGVVARPHYNNKDRHVIEFPGSYTKAELRDNGHLYVERLELSPEGIAAFAELVKKYGR
jgi:hypothetical protein